jgi:hypothetical protein
MQSKNAEVNMLRRTIVQSGMVRAPPPPPRQYDDTAQGGHQLHRTVSDTNSKW